MMSRALFTSGSWSKRRRVSAHDNSLFVSNVLKAMRQAARKQVSVASFEDAGDASNGDLKFPLDDHTAPSNTQQVPFDLQVVDL